MTALYSSVLLLHLLSFSLPFEFSDKECGGIIAPYHSPGDIQFGFFSKFKLNCSEDFEPTGILLAMTAQWAVDEINRNQYLIFSRFNFTLSLIMFETCNSFCRLMQQQDVCRPAWLRSNATYSRCEVSQDLSRRTYVSAIIADVKSFEAAVLLHLLWYRKLPMVGLRTSATSLTKNANRKYFVRMVPNDSYQTNVLIDLMRRFQWSYPIVLYEGVGSYGLGLYHSLKTKFDELWRLNGERFCIALSRKYSRGKVTVKKAKSIAREVYLLTNTTQVIILLGDWDPVLMHALSRLRVTYIFVDSVSKAPIHSLSQTEGSIFVSFHRGFVPAVIEKYNRLTWVDAITSLPFGKYYFSQRHKCCFECTNRRSCKTVSESERSRFRMVPDIARTHVDPPLLVNAIWALARAFSQVAESVCLNATVSRRHEKLLACVNGPLLMEALRVQQFQGMGMNVSFDLEGNGPPYYLLMQQVNGELQDRGTWQAEEGLKFSSNPFQWSGRSPPIARCSSACGPGSVQRLRNVPCCWLCERCRSREVASNGSCVPCPSLFWPDEAHLECLRLPIDNASWTGAKTVLNFALSAAGSLAGIVTLVAFAFKRNSRLVKASAAELVVVMIVGLLLAHVTIFTLFFRELSSTECCVRAVAYNLSLTIAYAALLVKSVRIFRLFNSSQQGPGQLRFVSTTAVLVATLLLCCLQVS